MAMIDQLAQRVNNTVKQSQDNRSILTKVTDFFTDDDLDKTKYLGEVSKAREDIWNSQIMPKLKAAKANDATVSQAYRTWSKQVDDWSTSNGFKLRQGQSVNQQRSDNLVRKLADADKSGSIVERAAARAKVVKVGTGAAATSVGVGGARMAHSVAQYVADAGDTNRNSKRQEVANKLKRVTDDVAAGNIDYQDIKQNGSKVQKIGLMAGEQVAPLVLTGGVAGATTKGALALGAGVKGAAAVGIGASTAVSYTQNYGDVRQGVEDEFKNATANQLATSKDPNTRTTFNSHYTKYLKKGLSQPDAAEQARLDTISDVAESYAEDYGKLVTALEPISAGAGKFGVKLAGGVAPNLVGKLATRAEQRAIGQAVKGQTSKVAAATAMTKSVTGAVTRSAAEEGAQEGLTDWASQKAAVDSGIKASNDWGQTKEAAVYGAILGGLFGGGANIATGETGYQHAKSQLSQIQQTQAATNAQLNTLQQQHSQLSQVANPTPEQKQQIQAIESNIRELETVKSDNEANAQRLNIPEPVLNKHVETPYSSTLNPLQAQTDNADNPATPDTSATAQTASPTDNTTNPSASPVNTSANPENPSASPTRNTENNVSSNNGGLDVNQYLDLDANSLEQAWVNHQQEMADNATITDGTDQMSVQDAIEHANNTIAEENTTPQIQSGIAGVVARNQQRQTQGELESEMEDWHAKKQQLRAERDAKLSQEMNAPDEPAIKLMDVNDGEHFDTTVIGLNGEPFRLANAWDSVIPAKAKQQAITTVFGGRLPQKLASASWGELHPQVQKKLHTWFAQELNNRRSEREQSAMPQLGMRTVAPQPVNELPSGNDPINLGHVASDNAPVDIPVNANSQPITFAQSEPNNQALPESSLQNLGETENLTPSMQTALSQVDEAPTTDGAGINDKAAEIDNLVNAAKTNGKYNVKNKEIILKSNGSPFSTQATLLTAIKNRKLKVDDYNVVSDGSRFVGVNKHSDLAMAQEEQLPTNTPDSTETSLIVQQGSSGDSHHSNAVPIDEKQATKPDETQQNSSAVDDATYSLPSDLEQDWKKAGNKKPVFTHRQKLLIQAVQEAKANGLTKDSDIANHVAEKLGVTEEVRAEPGIGDLSKFDLDVVSAIDTIEQHDESVLKKAMDKAEIPNYSRAQQIEVDDSIDQQAETLQGESVANVAEADAPTTESKDVGNKANGLITLDGNEVNATTAKNQKTSSTDNHDISQDNPAFDTKSAKQSGEDNSSVNPKNHAATDTNITVGSATVGTKPRISERDKPQYSKREQGEIGVDTSNRYAVVSDERARSIVSRIIDSIRSNASIEPLSHQKTGIMDFPIEVVPSFEALPEFIKQDSTFVDNDGKTQRYEVFGVWYEGKLYINSGDIRGDSQTGITTEQMYEHTILHEIVGHYGIQKLFGDSYKTQLAQLWNAIGGVPALRKIAHNNGVDMQAFERDYITPYLSWKQEEKYTADEVHQALIGEMFAHIAQNGKPTVKQRLKALVGYVRNWLRERGLMSLDKYNDSDILMFLNEAKRAAVDPKFHGKFANRKISQLSHQENNDKKNNSNIHDYSRSQSNQSEAQELIKLKRGDITIKPELLNNGKKFIDFYYRNEKLSDFLSDNHALQAYPQLGDIKVESAGFFDALFSYDKANNTIRVPMSYTNKQMEQGVFAILKDEVANLQKGMKPAKSAQTSNISKEQDQAYLDLATRYEQGDTSVEPQLREMVNKAAQDNGFDSDTSFRMSHAAPINDGFNDSADNLRNMFGDDIYSDNALHYFGMGDEYIKADRESLQAINRAKGKPNTMITVYRAMPKDAKGTAIGNGDWVTTSKEYAKEHGNHALNGDYKIATRMVPAKHLFNNGDSIHEWGIDTGQDLLRSKTVDREKLSDLITYDDKGKIIPLSKRFNAAKKDVRYSFAGINSETINTEKYQQALDMENSGLPMDRIFEKTGFFKGKDGEWRYEIDDSTAKININRDELNQYDSDSKLSYVLDHDELFEAYPFLHDVRLKLTNTGRDYAGVWLKDENLIKVDKNLSLEDMKSVILHEVQHAIQSHEGLNRGGNKSAGFINSLVGKIINKQREAYNNVRSKIANEYSVRREISDLQREMKSLAFLQSALRLRDYAHRDKPSSMYRHIRNEVQWLYHISSDKSYGEFTNKQADELARKWYYLPNKKSKKFNAEVGQYILDVANFLEDLADWNDVETYNGDRNQVEARRKSIEGKVARLGKKILPTDRQLWAIEKMESRVNEIQDLSADQFYRALAGEVEARNVQTRMNMTADERAKSNPISTEDVPRDKQIAYKDINGDGLSYFKTKGQSAINNVTKTLSDKFGKAIIDKLINDGALEVIDYAEAKRRDPNLPQNTDGFYVDGKAVLIADNLSPDMIVSTFLHELGGHGGLQTLMSDKAYQSLMKEFDRMVADGNPLAKDAKAFADAVSRNEKEAQDEYLPYLISLAAKGQGNSKVKSMLNRIVLAVKSFIRDKFGVSLKVTPADIVALAEKMVQQRATESNVTTNMPTQYSKRELLAPNGKPSNLTPEQYAQVRTKEFKAWFGDWENDPDNASKVVDENGEPLVVYHGTVSDKFTIFNKNKKNGGIFFTSNQEIAKGYSGFDETDNSPMQGELLPVFLSIKNPSIIDGKGADWHNINGAKTDNIVALKSSNDGVILNNIKDGITENTENIISDVFVAYSPNQIKSATNNTGTFDPNNDDIRYSKNTKGATDTTPTQVRNTLVKQFGEKTVKALEDAGMLHIKQLSDFVDENGNLSIADDAEGFFHDGKAVLIADNIDANQIVPVFLHEVGGHAGLQNMLSPNAYANLMQTFDAMVARGDEIALRAKQRAELASENQDQATTEYLPYLLSEISNAQAKTPFIKRLLDRFVGAVRAWVYAKTGVRMNLTHADILGLAELTIKERARNIERTAKLIKQVNKQYSQPATNQSIDDVNKTFNDELKHYVAGKLNGSHVFKLGYPNQILKSTGFPNQPIELRASKLSEKANTEWHKFDIAEVKDLPKALEHPLAVFYYYNQARNVITQIEVGGKQLLVGIHFTQNSKGIEINDIRGLFPKDNHEWLNWITESNPKGDSKLMYVDKQKIQALIDQQRTNLAEVEYLDLDLVESIVQKFENVNIPSYSRRFAPIQQSPIPNKPAAKKAADWLNLQWATKWVSWDTFSRLIRRNIATPQHVAITHADYKKFWDLVQQRINYTNYEAANAVGLVPEILDKRLIIGQNKKDIEAVSKVIFDGTMNDIVYGDTELTRKGLTDKQIDLYRRVRQAIDESVEKMAIDVLANSAKGTGLVSLDEILRIKEAVVATGGNVHTFNTAMQQAVNAKIQAMQQAGVIDAVKAAKLTTMFGEVAKQMDSVADRVISLQDEGYAPLMRFGSYAVAVNDSKGDLVLYELYETKREQQKALHDLKKNPDYAGMTFNQNVLNPGDYQQFTNKGLNPETVMLFANELGLSSDEANQAYLKVAIAQQSALKRLIHRKKVAGFSEDLPRVLSAFVMSNARHSSRMLYNGDIQKAQQAIKDGDLRGEAQNLFENMENPAEEFASFRSMMFHWNMGFSPAFGLLNMTQPFIQTIPQLTMYDGVIGAHKSVLNGIRKAMASQVLEDAKGLGIAKNAKDFVDTIPAYMRDDYIRMTKEGHLDPQNVWLLQGLERGKAGVASGALGMIGQAAGYISEATETINRRATMYAALEIAHKLGAAKLKAKGFDSAYDFAVTTIQQTQGVYNKGNRSGLARSTGAASKFGAVIMMYKQFSINLIEQQIRMGQQKQGKALATAWVYQWLIAGSMGLIAADDLKDLIETIAFKFGYALNSERKIQEFFINSFGKDQGNDLYQMFMYGIPSAISPIDFHGRSSAGNLIPASGILHPANAKPEDRKAVAMELLGVGSSWVGNMFDAAGLMMNGQFRDAMVTAAPRYIRDSVQAYEIATTGSMRDKNGRKVMDMTQGDAVAKALQFNPKSNAQRGREAMSNWQDKKLIENVKGDFTVKLAEAIASKDQAAQDKVMADIDKWNAKNDKQYQMDKTKITKSATDKAKKRDFTADERQTMPKSLEAYVNSLKKTG